MRAFFRSWKEKFQAYYSDSEKALNTVLIVFYVYFIFSWVVARIYLSPVVSFRYHEAYSVVILQVLIAPVMMFYLFCKLISVQVKKAFGCMFLFLLSSITLSILIFPYSTMQRDAYFTKNEESYEAAVQYAIDIYEQTGKVRIVMPEKYIDMIMDDQVYIATEQGVLSGVFFPIRSGLDTMKGFLCDIDMEQYQQNGVLQYDWKWEEGVYLYKLLEMHKEVSE